MTRDKQLMTYDSLHVGEVNSLAFSRLSSVFMLTAHNDGSVCLFHTKQGTASNAALEAQSKDGTGVYLVF